MAESLSKGVIEGALIPWEVVPATKTHELTKYHAEAGGEYAMTTATMIFVMNQKKYDSLPPDLRKVIDDHSGAWAAEFNGKVWDQNELVGIEAIKKAGGTIYTVPAEERQRWAARLKSVEDDWVKSMEARGLPGRQLLGDLREAIKKYDQ